MSAHQLSFGFARPTDPRPGYMPQPLVSVLIRSMDRPTLGRALASVSVQDYAPLEVVVVAASGQRHRALPEHCGPHPLRLVVPDHPLPRADACNAALDHARGEWLNFLDDDDELLPGHVTALRRALETNPDARLAHAQSLMVASDGTTSIYGSEFQPWRQLDGGCFQFAGAMFARSLISEGVRADPRFDILEDLDFFVQCAQRTRFVFVPSVTSRWRTDTGTSGTGDARNADPARVTTALAAVHAKWADLKRHLDALPESRLARAQGHLRGGRNADALSLLRLLVGERPTDVNALNLCGVAELRTGGAAAARVLFQRALARAPGHPALLDNLRLAEAALAVPRRDAVLRGNVDDA